MTGVFYYGKYNSKINRKTIAEWSRDIRAMAGYQEIFERITKLGWDAERAITTPTRYIDYSNKSKYVGVSFVKQSGKWKAYTTINGKRVHIGHYPTEEEAHQARENYINNLNSPTA